MKRLLVLGIITLGTFLTTACPPVQDTTRNAIAAANAVIAKEQASHLTQCTADPAAGVCVLINAGVKAVNTAIDAEELYCSGAPATGVQSFDNGGPCTPNLSYKGVLTQALLDLNKISSDIKGLN